jgi:hypothetical protein
MPAPLRKALGAYPQRTYVRPPAYAPKGQGNYGVPAMRKLGLYLGDGSNDQLLTDLPTLISTSGTGAANIISAIRANPNNLVPTTAQGATAGGYGTAVAGVTNWTPILLIGGVGLAVALFAMRDEPGRR